MKMNLKRILLIIIALFQMINLFSQRVEFTYDDNGNRLTRTIVVEQLRSESVSFPVVDPKSLKPIDKTMAKGLVVPQKGTTTEDAKTKGQEGVTKENISSEDGEIVTLIYPNPSKGLIKIDISNMPLNSKNEIRLFDLSGNELTVRTNIESNSEMDISQYKDGIYILRIKINERIFYWKVVKNHY